MNGTNRYGSARTHRGATPVHFLATYGPAGPVTFAEKGGLADFLTNRLCLYSVSRSGGLFRGNIDHARWPLQPAEAEIERNQMTEPIGINLPNTKPLLHFSAKLDVVAWRIRSIEM